jgi:hypothetical protein
MLGGSFFDGKGQPGQVNAVSHGSVPARFKQINVINTGRRHEACLQLQRYAEESDLTR